MELIVMAHSDLDRRDFHRLTLAAFGGLMTGAVGCSETKPAAAPTADAPTAASEEMVLSADAEALILDEPHTCRGLNTCKELGRGKDNTCAGLGTCASVADHACATQNECKGQGGCGQDPGMNACKGQGSCHIPLMDNAWETARKAFETAMKKQGKTFGAAPAKAS
jgi:hypothetical protein